MKRKDYEKPTMKVVQLKHRTSLLVGSEQVNATMNGTFTEEDI